MPPAPPLLPHARVLRTADRGHGGVAGHADVAADALADVLQAALLDLLGQERVGDRRPRGADEVEHSVSDHPHHRVGRREAADPDHRLGGESFSPRTCCSWWPSSSNRAVAESSSQGPATKSQQVGQLAHPAQHLLDVLPPEALLAHQLVDRDPAGHRNPAVDLLERVLEQLPQQPGAVLEAAAVAVGAEVVERRQELPERVQPVRGVHVDEVETGLDRRDMARRCQRRRSAMS